MVEGDAAGGHVHGHRFGDLIAALSHLIDDALAVDPELDRLEPLELVSARYEVQTAIVWRDIVDCDPRRQCSDRIHRPVGRVLVPVGFFARLAGGFDHRVVVVDAHVAAAAQTPRALGQPLVEGDLFGVRVIGPEVDHLVEDALVVCGGPAVVGGALDAGTTGSDGVVDSLVQAGYFSCGKKILVADIAVGLVEIGVLGGNRAG